LNCFSKMYRKAAGLFLAAVMVLSLTACLADTPEPTSEAQTASTGMTTSPDTTASPEAAAAAETAAQLTDEEVFARAISSYYEPKTLYESAQISVGLVDLMEDSTYYHVIMKAENKTDEEINLEVNALAFNGVTMESGNGWTVPASGNAYLFMTFEKKMLEEAGLHGTPGAVKVGITVYDSNYEKTDSGFAECVVDGANSEAVTAKDGTCVYDENGVKAYFAGIAGGSAEERYLKFVVENNTEDLVWFNGGAGMAPGTELSPSIYTCVLPGTIAVALCYLYGADYASNIDPETIPFADILFSVELDGGERTVITEPIRIDLGKELRYAVSEDGKTVTLTMDYWDYDDCEWTVTSENADVMTVESCKMEKDGAAEGKQRMTAVLRVKGPGETEITCKYHPTGISLEATDDYWPTVYSTGSIRFAVAEDGTVAPGDVWLEVPNLSGEGNNSFWYYIIKNDGSVAAKNDAAG